ncbi:hypothetical protein C0J52_20016 [Blattella germanica]|nr:hypothetical protein C0J52_20016 [Blattella germanica]
MYYLVLYTMYSIIAEVCHVKNSTCGKLPCLQVIGELRDYSGVYFPIERNKLEIPRIAEQYMSVTSGRRTHLMSCPMSFAHPEKSRKSLVNPYTMARLRSLESETQADVYKRQSLVNPYTMARLRSLESETQADGKQTVGKLTQMECDDSARNKSLTETRIVFTAHNEKTSLLQFEII